MTSEAYNRGDECQGTRLEATTHTLRFVVRQAVIMTLWSFTMSNGQKFGCHGCKNLEDQGILKMGKWSKRKRTGRKQEERRCRVSMYTWDCSRQRGRSLIAPTNPQWFDSALEKLHQFLVLPLKLFLQVIQIFLSDVLVLGLQRFSTVNILFNEMVCFICEFAPHENLFEGKFVDSCAHRFLPLWAELD